jgi:hypothetical protein
MVIVHLLNYFAVLKLDLIAILDFNLRFDFDDGLL